MKLGCIFATKRLPFQRVANQCYVREVGYERARRIDGVHEGCADRLPRYIGGKSQSVGRPLIHQTEYDGYCGPLARSRL